MPQFVKMGIGTQGYMPKAGASLRAQARRRARRIIRPGYPRYEPFHNEAEIAAYFAGDTIECLLCGRHLLGLGRHLPRIHGLSEDAYRERFGLPWRRGLTCAPTHERYVAAGNAMDKDRLRNLVNEFRGLAIEAPRRPKTAIQLNQCKQRILHASSLVEYTDRHFDLFLGYIAQGMTPQEVTALAGMPSLTAWRGKRRRDQRYNERFEAVWDSLPFVVQARAQRLGRRFEAECDRLFREGRADWQIADALGVTTMTVNRRTRRLRAAKVSA